MDLREELKVIYPNLLRFAVSRTRDPDVGEDMVLKACVRILEREQTFDSSLNLVAYGITIIRNLINDRWRSRGKISDEELPELPDRSEPGAIYEIMEALGKLSENCQEILDLWAMGNSYREISECLDIPMGTVMGRMSKCRDNFRIELNG